MTTKLFTIAHPLQCFKCGVAFSIQENLNAHLLFSHGFLNPICSTDIHLTRYQTALELKSKVRLLVKLSQKENMSYGRMKYEVMIQYNELIKKIAELGYDTWKLPNLHYRFNLDNKYDELEYFRILKKERIVV